MGIAQRRRLVTAIPGPKSRALQARRAAAVPAGVGAALPVFIESAEGAILRDVDGNQLIDLAAGMGVVNTGHLPAPVQAALTAQIEAFTHVCFALTPHESYLHLAETLNDLTPGEFEKRTALFVTGGEAVENAIKIARRYTGRPAVVAFDHAYHGRTNLALALTAKVSPYKEGFGPFAPEIYRVPMAYPFRWPTGAARCGEEAFSEFVDRIYLQIGVNNVAAVIIEPIQGEGGIIVPPPGFLAAVADWCRKQGVVFIADEIQSGFCRTGEWFASSAEGVAPDLLVMGKGMAAGLPLSAVTGRADIMDAVQPGGLGGTFGGNPLAVAAASANIALMRDGEYCSRARKIESAIRERLTALTPHCEVIGEIRGRGAMIGVELIVAAGDITPHPALASAVVRHCHERGVLVLASGPWRNTLRLLPPLNIDEALLYDALDVLADALVNAT